MNSWIFLTPKPFHPFNFSTFIHLNFFTFSTFHLFNFSTFSFKPFHPSPEDAKTLATELLQAAQGLLRCLLNVETRLGIELVGIADNLFLDALGCEVLTGQGQVLPLYLDGRKSCPRVPLRHAGMTGQPLAAQDFPTQEAMTDIGLRAETMDGRRISANTPDVVQHSRLPEERLVSTQFGVRLGYLQRPPRHVLAVPEQNLFQRLIAFAILMNQLVYHLILYLLPFECTKVQIILHSSFLILHFFVPLQAKQEESLSH